MSLVSVLLALVSGLFLPLAFAPWGWFPVALLSPAVLFFLWLSANPRQAFWLGMIFGIGYFGLGVSWVYVSVHDFGHVPAPVAVIITGLFVAVMALFPALAGYVGSRIAGSQRHALLLVYPATWVLAEWARGTVFTGFPWLHLGYSQLESPLRALAPVLGVYGVSWITALIAGVMVFTLRTRGNQRWIAAAMVLLTLSVSARFSTQIWTEPSGPKFSVALVQGNIPQDQKWQLHQRQPTLDLYQELTLAHTDVDVVIWPETAVPAFWRDVEADYLKPLHATLRAEGVTLVTGIPMIGDSDSDYRNAMITLGAEQGIYHKRHLVPFGEVFPFKSLLGGIYELVFGVYSSFTPGADDQPLPTVKGYPTAMSICYEIAFGEEVIESLPEAELLINTSNDAWFGSSIAADQHIEIARMRALETGRYLLRATNTGVTAVISPTGTLLAQAPQFEQFVLEAEVLPMQGATPYVKIGNRWLLLLPVLLIVSLVMRRRQ